MKTSIAVEEETLKNLNLMKYALGIDTLDDVITKLITSYKIQQEKEK